MIFTFKIKKENTRYNRLFPDRYPQIIFIRYNKENIGIIENKFPFPIKLFKNNNEFFVIDKPNQTLEDARYFTIKNSDQILNLINKSQYDKKI